MHTILRATLTALFLSLSLPACGPPTVQGAESRYKSNQDRLSAIVTRKPQSKPEIDAKVIEFKAEYDKAMAETSDDKKISALSALSSRMDKYIEMLEPKETKAGGAGAPSNKLDAKTPPSGPATPATPPVTTPGKLDAPTPAGTPTTPGSGGMGSAPITAPTPTPTPTPAPTPTAAPASGGMGGM